MDYSTINGLLEKYFAGETSLAEEEQLRAYFIGPAVDPRLARYQPLFAFLAAERMQTVPDERLDPPHHARVRSLRTYAWAVSIAAMVVLALGLWWLAPQPEPEVEAPIAAAIDWSRYEVEDPEEAARILSASLRKVGDALNEGTRQAMDGMERVERLAEPIQ